MSRPTTGKNLYLEYSKNYHWKDSVDINDDAWLITYAGKIANIMHIIELKSGKEQRQYQHHIYWTENGAKRSAARLNKKYHTKEFGILKVIT